MTEGVHVAWVQTLFLGAVQALPPGVILLHNNSHTTSIVRSMLIMAPVALSVLRTKSPNPSPANGVPGGRP